MDASEMRSDITDRGIEKAEHAMKEVLQPLSQQLREHAGMTDSAASTRGQANTPLTATNCPERDTPKPVENSKQRDVPPDMDEETVRNRKVNPEAVRESFKEAELDPVAETEPEEGETAA